MGMELNIRSDEAFALATELAALTGESRTAAVTQALRERLERERRAQDKAGKVKRMLAIAQEVRALMASPRTNALHDEDGQ